MHPNDRPSTREEPLNPDSFWVRLNNARLLRYLLLLVLGWAIAQLFSYFWKVTALFTIAAILAFLLGYPVKWLQRWMPRVLATLLVFLGMGLLLGGFMFTIGATVLSQGQELVNQAPALANALLEKLAQAEAFLERFRFQVDFSMLEESLRSQTLGAAQSSLSGLQTVLQSLLDLILIVVIGIFMVLDGDRLWNWVLHRFPASIQPKLTEAVQQNLLGFFWGRFLLSLFFGVSCLLVFLVVRAPFPVLLATIAGVFDMIPGVGATLGVALVCLILLPQGIWFAAGILVACVLIQQVQENVLMPKIMQGSINMNPVVMFFALLVGARLAGLLGLFLSVPIAGVLISLFDVEDMKAKH